MYLSFETLTKSTSQKLQKRKEAAPSAQCYATHYLLCPQLVVKTEYIDTLIKLLLYSLTLLNVLFMDIWLFSLGYLPLYLLGRLFTIA